MLDIRFIRENAELVEKKAQQKGYKVDIRKLLELDKKRRETLSSIEKFKHDQKEFAKIYKENKHLENDREAWRQQKETIKEYSETLKTVELEYGKILHSVPNVFPDDTPLGGEEANREEKTWGDVEAKDFEVVDHLTWGEQRGLIDFERGAKVAGAKFYFLKGGLVELELAITQMGMELAKKHGFAPMIVPHLVNTKTLEGAGFSARGAEKQIYKIEDEDLNLIATAEIPLTGLHTNEILNEKDLPILYAGISPAYRVEGGAYGKHNRGLFRTHQFNKLELYGFCSPEASEQLHQKIVDLEEEFCQLLEIPYRVVRIASGDLGAPAYKKFDVEYWSPLDKCYRELMSCSNVTDYQARRLNIRYKNSSGENKYVHTLNGTLAAMSRIPIALIENHQTKDGEVAIPKVLQPYMQGQKSL